MGSNVTNQPLWLHLICSTTNYLDKKIPVVVIFFDMTRAFDFVDHMTLLRKCENYGIRGFALGWLEKYLKNRQQCVEIVSLNKDHESSVRSYFKNNNYGVPQGSILGPLLFLLYINDLPEVIKHQCVLFADDISIIIPNDDNLMTYEMKINEAVISVIDWLQRNNLSVNLSKTKYIKFSTINAKNYSVHIKINDESIEETDSIKFLGITLDKYCNWKKHIMNICSKLSGFVYAIKKLRTLSDKKTALIVYYGYVESILRYGLIIWGNSTDAHKAFIVQKKVSIVQKKV